VFESISPSNINFYVAKYPELKSAETAIKLVDEIRSLRDDIYKQQIEREKHLKTCRFATQNPWSLYFFIPEIPEDLIQKE